MAATLQLVNPRRRHRRRNVANPRRHHRRRGLMLMRNPAGQFVAANPHRRHRRRNPYHPGHMDFLPFQHHRRHRNPSLAQLEEGVDLMDFGVAAGAFFGADLAANTYASVTGQTAPSPFLVVGLKALWTIAAGFIAQELLGRGPSAVLGAGLNTVATAVDILAPAVSQPLPFPIAPATPQTVLPPGTLPLTSAGAL